MEESSCNKIKTNNFHFTRYFYIVKYNCKNNFHRKYYQKITNISSRWVSFRCPSIVHHITYVTREYNTRSSFPGLNRFVRYSRRTRFHSRGSTFPTSIKSTLTKWISFPNLCPRIYRALTLAPENSPNFRDRRSLKTTGELEEWISIQIRKKKNNQTCIREDLCSTPFWKKRDERVEMWRIINATFFLPFFMDARPREGTLMISQGIKST